MPFSLSNRIRADGPFGVIVSKEYRPALIVFICILIGNFGYYFLRAHWVIALPSMKDEKITDNFGYSQILTACYVMNCIGKLTGGYVIDYTNRPKFGFVFFLILTAGTAGAVTFFDTFTSLIIFWSVSRLFTTMGKMSVIKILAIYWPAGVMGTVIGIATVSYNIGESLSKIALAFTLGQFSDDWRKMFYVASACAMVSIVPTVFLVKDRNAPMNHTLRAETPVELNSADSSDTKKTANSEKGLVDPPTTPVQADKKSNFAISLLALLKNPKMVLLMFMSMAITSLREILGGWSINFLKDDLLMSNSESGSYTGVFCVCSAFGTIIGGRLIDSVPKRHRGIVNSFYMLGIAVSLAILVLFTNGHLKVDSLQTKQIVCIVLISVAELFMGAPVSFVDGIYVVDLVEPSQVAFASGVIGCLGYMGPIIHNQFLPKWTSEGAGRWYLVYTYGASCAVFSALIGLTYWLSDLRSFRRSQKKTDQA